MVGMELIISIPSDASHLYLVKPVSHASLAEAAISVHASGTVLYLEALVLVEALSNSVNPKLPISLKTL